MNNESLKINYPTLFNEDKKGVSRTTFHTLKANDDGSFRYTKYNNVPGLFINNDNVKYIDVNAFVKNNLNQTTYYRFSVSTSTNQYTTANRTTAREASAGTHHILGQAVISGTSSFTDDMQGSQSWWHVSRSSSNFGTSRRYEHGQSYKIYDTSAVTTEVTDAVYTFRASKSQWDSNNTGGTSRWANPQFKIAKADPDEFEDTASIFVFGGALTNYNSFLGHGTGWGDGDVTWYSDAKEITNNNGVAGLGGTLTTFTHTSAFTSDSSETSEWDDYT